MSNKLNLGCGRDYREGYWNVDISPKVGADEVINFQRGLPYADDRFEEVICQNILTQILLPERFVHMMNELWRVTKGHVIVTVPNAKHIRAWQDPMDCRRFTDQSFTYMEEGHRRFEQYGKHYGFKPFTVEMLENTDEQIIVKLCPRK